MLTARRAVEETTCWATDWLQRYMDTPIVGRVAIHVWFHAHHNRLYWWATR